MSKAMLRLMDWKSSFRFRYQHILYVVVCALIIVTFAVFFSEKILGSGKNLMAYSLFSTDKYSSWYVPFLRITGSVLIVYNRRRRRRICPVFKCRCKYWFCVGRLA